MAPSKNKGKGITNAKAESSQSVSSKSKIGKPLLKDQTRETQKSIRRLEEISREYSELAKGLSEDALSLLVDRPAFISMLEPLAGPSTVGQLGASVIEASRYAEKKDCINVGTARKKAARSSIDKFLAAIDAQVASDSAARKRKNSGSRSGSVKRAKTQGDEGEDEFPMSNAAGLEKFMKFAREALARIPDGDRELDRIRPKNME
ncbi:hypothetical protein EAE96_003488 [Botrytis aclada]|nr:hypothetical protein EAE96_003488 [Botrytis aclada]